jgi:hypothetical protein
MIPDDEILAIIRAELSDTDYNKDDGKQEEALAYYLGLPNGSEVEGRSQVTSTDVADTIEWIMPQVMKSFTQNNEVVIFDPTSEGDEEQAEMESEYVYDVLMKKNKGFIVLHQFVKDALMQRNGLLKVYYVEEETVETKDFTGLNVEQLNMIVADDSIELLELSEGIDTEMSMQAQREIKYFNIKVKITKTKQKIQIDPVPPEEFRINSFHNSIDTSEARFTAHVLTKTVSDLRKLGIPDKTLAEMNEGSEFIDKLYRFSMQDEDSSISYESVDESQRLVEVSECYMQMDIDGSGISQLVKVLVAGGDTPTHVLSIETIDSMPWISTTAFLMSHKYQGLSVYDRIKEIQDQKTALWRNMLDNVYLQNNQRNEVLEGSVNMDDLLVSRPGGVIRVKRSGAVRPLPTPQMGQDAYNMMEYLDRVRAGRSGVDPDGTATPSNIGDRVGSEGVERLMNAKEELVGLIIRVIAETGLKPLCYKIRDLSVAHVDAVSDFKFRGQWQQINPAAWGERTSCTVRVGTGTGNHGSQVGALQQVMDIQERVLQNPSQNIVNQKKVFDAIDDFCKFSGLNGAIRYFIDPNSDEGKKKAEEAAQQSQEQSEQQQQMEQAMADAQNKLADAEMAKAQAQNQGIQFKAQKDIADNNLSIAKQDHARELDIVTKELDEARIMLDAKSKSDDLDFKYDNLDSNVALELTRIKSQEKIQKDAYAESKKEVESNDE